MLGVEERVHEVWTVDTSGEECLHRTPGHTRWLVFRRYADASAGA